MLLGTLIGSGSLHVNCSHQHAVVMAKIVLTHLLTLALNDDVGYYSAFTPGRMSLNKSLYMQLKTLLTTLFSGSVHTSDMWSNLASDMR